MSSNPAYAPTGEFTEIELAGMRVDAANAEFTLISARIRLGIMPEFEEARFGRAEAAFLEAQTAYGEALRAATGESPETVLRRLGR